MGTLELINAKVWHKRTEPKQNEFTYRVFYIAHRLGGPLKATPNFFSFDRLNILSLHAKDHGPRDGGDLYSWACEEFQKINITKEDEDSIELVTHPRVFGYAFNPISFYFLRNNQGELRAVICEVSNTFNEYQNYILAKEDGAPISPSDVFVAPKELYVSPFNTMKGYYTFSFKRMENKFKADIVYFNDDAIVLQTAVVGTFKPLTSAAALSVLITHPLMTLMVIFRIHWQALRLFLKGVPETLTERKPEHVTSTTRGQLH